METTAIYHKTDKGKQEVAERAFGLENHARRLLIMIDGQRATAELSVYIRAGEFEKTLERLLAEGFVEAVGTGEKDPDLVVRAPAADDPIVFAGIKIQAMTEIRSQMVGRLASLGEMLVQEISACPTPLAMREKLRTLEESLIRLLGPEEGVALARKVGSELTRLTAK